jgi:hypothetical protein
VCVTTEARTVLQPKEKQNPIDSLLTGYERLYPGVGKFKATVQVDTDKKTVTVTGNEAFGNIPFRPWLVNELYHRVDSLVQREHAGFKVQLFAKNSEIGTLVPNYFRENGTVDKSRFPQRSYKGVPLIQKLTRPYAVTAGLNNTHLAIWDSHGLYFNRRTDRWEWQRPRLFQSVEDKLAMSFVLPYLLPMLENAGATVLLPRERDIQTHEVVVDNDSCQGNSVYRESGSRWESGGHSAFGLKKHVLEGNANPFTEGTYRRINVQNAETSTVEWIPDIPEDGWYAVSIAYKSLNNSTTDAHYRVCHTGGTDEFSVNQQMGGGTWIYLGNFYFAKGVHPEAGRVELSDKARSGRIVTADAVRFGGGMGNIARPDSPAYESTPKDSLAKAPVSVAARQKTSVSGYPRYLECARYWLQWAGMPADIYNKRKDDAPSDYNDDIWARPYWVNYLNRGSVFSANDSLKEGLKIPVDLALAFHTDAGSVPNDTIIGTLAICTTARIGTTFGTGQSRLTSRDLADMVEDQIVNDVRALFDSKWTNRGIWDRSYAETRETDVPTMLLELLSHQNFQDMKSGLDPRFRFIASRAIYKGVLKYLAFQRNRDYAVQPLPVRALAAVFSDETHVRLSWKPTNDSLEKSAVPSAYAIYTRIDGQGFGNPQIAYAPSIDLAVEQGKIYSFKVTAINAGGESMPSEIISVCRNWDAPVAMIINGFDRVSAPSWFETPAYAGFTDQGVPCGTDISYTGKQNNFQRQSTDKSNDEPGFGGSDANFETQALAGNTFDFPYIHGRALKASGYSFVSCSREAFANDSLRLGDYTLVDLILGKQKTSPDIFKPHKPVFRTFDNNLKRALSAYCATGGNLFVSGSFVGTDLWNNGPVVAEDTLFAVNTLKFRWHSSNASRSAEVSGSSNVSFFTGKWNFCTQPDSHCYGVESPDGIDPVGDRQQSFVLARYSDNNVCAAVASRGSGKTIICGFPFESILTEDQRVDWMKKCAAFFGK